MKANGEDEKIQQLLGAGGDVQLVPMFVPGGAYKMLLEAAKMRGMSVSDLLSRALESYLQPPKEQDINTNQHAPPPRTPNFVIKRKV